MALAVPSYRNKLIAALTGDDPLSVSPDPTDPTHGTEPGGFAGTGNTTETPRVETPASAPTSGGYDTSGLDPNNPIDAVFIKNKYKQGGIGSGFGDLDYWRQHADQAARLDADQLGRGTDQPGPGDVGNTSRDPNLGRGGLGFVNPFQTASDAAGQQANDPANSILARIMAAISQYGGG